MNFEISFNIQKVIIQEADKTKTPEKFVKICEELVPLLIDRGDSEENIIEYIKHTPNQD